MLERLNGKVEEVNLAKQMLRPLELEALREREMLLREHNFGAAGRYNHMGSAGPSGDDCHNGGCGWGSEGTVCYVPEADIGSLEAGMTVRIEGEEYAIGQIARRPVAVDESFDAYAIYMGGLEQGQWVYPVKVDASLDKGVYEAKIVLDSVSPISFLLN